MKKHLIIHGDEVSGKSIFINNLLKPRAQSVEKISGRNIDTLKGEFLWRLGDHRPEYLWFKDLNINIHPEQFLPFTDTIKVNAQMQEVFYLKPMLILEYSQALDVLPTESCFTRRFDVFNTNVCSYRELIDYLKAFTNA